MTTTACRCALFKAIDVDEFHSESPVSRFERLAKRPEPQWWLSLSRCSDCGQQWLVGQEERLNDVYVIKRLEDEEADAVAKGRWPTNFDRYEDLLCIGKDHGYAAGYADPNETLPICIDLVGQNPSILPETVAELINVTLDQARRLVATAKSEIANRGYPYRWVSVRADG